MTHDPLLKYREQHKHRLNYMPWLYWTLKPKHREWAEAWQAEYQAYLMEMETVEIGNTDAEGRLVLADAMSYIIDKEKPTEIIDIATLTGACMVALGGSYAGLFSNSEKMAEGLKEAGDTVGERLWRLPIDDAYAAKPLLADLNNDGSRFGGASTAAVFLKNFVGDTPWAHLDIAGVGIGEKIPGTSPVDGASGFGAKIFVNYLEKDAS